MTCSGKMREAARVTELGLNSRMGLFFTERMLHPRSSTASLKSLQEFYMSCISFLFNEFSPSCILKFYISARNQINLMGSTEKTLFIYVPGTFVVFVVILAPIQSNTLRHKRHSDNGKYHFQRSI